MALRRAFGWNLTPVILIYFMVLAPIRFLSEFLKRKWWTCKISWKKIIRLNVGHGESDIHFLENVPFFENINKSYICIECIRGFPGGSDGKESACNVGDSGLIPGLGKSPGEGNRNPLQCSCLENPMDSGAWQATVHGVARSQHDWTTNIFTLFTWVYEVLSYLWSRYILMIPYEISVLVTSPYMEQSSFNLFLLDSHLRC